MPHEWLSSDETTQRLHLWPYRSLPRRGMVWFLGVTATASVLPLMGLIGSPVLWGLLPFLLATIAAVWGALEKSFRDAEIVEDLEITRDALRLTRHGPKGKRQDWQANPYWVRLRLHATGGPVPQYLTLKGEGREVELGAFLTEAERKLLAAEITERLRKLR